MTDFRDLGAPAPGGPSDVDRRIAAALQAAAGQVGEDTLRPALAPRASSLAPRRHVRWTAPLLAAAAVVGVVAGTVAVTSSTSSSRPRQVPVGSNLPVSSSLPSTPVPSTTASPTDTSSFPSSSDPPTASPGLFSADCPFEDVPCTMPVRSHYVPLWPFTSYLAARQWQASVAKGGTSTTGDAAAWHGDAGSTARTFLDEVLGFTDVDVISSVSPTTGSSETDVQVGYRDQSGTVHVTAALHLVRYGPQVGAVLAPWEVVGTDDNPALTLSTPPANSLQHPPMTVAGTVTGSNENLVVTVRSRIGQVLGTSAPLSAGGDGAPWATSVVYKGGSGQPMMVVVFGSLATGAIAKHGKFAISAFYG